MLVRKYEIIECFQEVNRDIGILGCDVRFVPFANVESDFFPFELPCRDSINLIN